MLAALVLSSLGALLSEPTRHSYHALRHGQSLANVEGIISSNPDVATREHGLSELGLQQAAAAAADVAEAVDAKNCRGVAIYTSDFKRAAETAETVHAALPFQATRSATSSRSPRRTASASCPSASAP